MVVNCSTAPAPSVTVDPILAKHGLYGVTRDRRLRDELLTHYDPLAISLARRLGSRRDHIDDLVQVARIGLIKAIDRFDVYRERPFVVFAQVTINGELKRHIRDHTWRIRPPRSLQEHHLAVLRTVDDLTHELGRSPLIHEVAARAGLTDEQVLEAMEVSASAPVSLDTAPPNGAPSVAELGGVDPRFEQLENHHMLERAVIGLPEQDQRILTMRFVEGLSQAEIGARLGVSQMAISRALSRILRRLQARLENAPI